MPRRLALVDSVLVDCQPTAYHEVTREPCYASANEDADSPSGVDEPKVTEPPSLNYPALDQREYHARYAETQQDVSLYQSAFLQLSSSYCGTSNAPHESHQFCR